MSALINWVVTGTDPVTAIGLVYLVKEVRGLRRDLQANRARIERMESEHIGA